MPLKLAKTVKHTIMMNYRLRQVKICLWGQGRGFQEDQVQLFAIFYRAN